MRIQQNIKFFKLRGFGDFPHFQKAFVNLEKNELYCFFDECKRTLTVKGQDKGALFLDYCAKCPSHKDGVNPEVDYLPDRNCDAGWAYLPCEAGLTRDDFLFEKKGVEVSLPPHVFAVKDTDEHLFAYELFDKERAEAHGLKEGINLLPLIIGNVFPSGKICWGYVRYPGSPAQAYVDFFESPFNNDLNEHQKMHSDLVDWIEDYSVENQLDTYSASWSHLNLEIDDEISVIDRELVDNPAFFGVAQYEILPYRDALDWHDYDIQITMTGYIYEIEKERFFFEPETEGYYLVSRISNSIKRKLSKSNIKKFLERLMNNED